MRRRLEVNIFEFRLLVWREHTGCIRTAAVSDHPTASMAEMPVEECGDLAKSTRSLVKFIDYLLSCWFNYSSWRLQSPVVAGISGRAAQEKRNAKSKYNEMV
jgi:hypothetical protein